MQFFYKSIVRQLSSISNHHNKLSSAVSPLQRKAGGFFKPVQRKLTVNQPNDVYEQEADAIADKVMRMTDNDAVQAKFFQPTISMIQRKCAHCEEEEKKDVQRKETNGNTEGADKDFENYVNNAGAGQSLSGETRNFYEPRFGYDFSQVKVHTDEAAARSAQSVNALAYTSGNNIVFNSGQFSPNTESGKKLLSHELTHVVQQGKTGQVNIQRQQAAPPVTHRFTAFGVNVVVRASCEPAVFGFATVEDGVRAAFDAIFNTECIEESRRTRIQRNLTAHGLDIRCRRSANLITPGSCAESTGFFIPANIFTLGSLSFPGHPEGDAACQPLESTILHEIVHLTRGFAGEQLPSSCEASCFGAGGGDPVLCRDIDVFGNRRAAP